MHDGNTDYKFREMMNLSDSDIITLGEIFLSKNQNLRSIEEVWGGVIPISEATYFYERKYNASRIAVNCFGITETLASNDYGQDITEWYAEKCGLYYMFCGTQQEAEKIFEKFLN